MIRIEEMKNHPKIDNHSNYYCFFFFISGLKYYYVRIKKQQNARTMSFAPIVLTMHDHTVSLGWKLFFYYYNYCCLLWIECRSLFLFRTFLLSVCLGTVGFVAVALISLHVIQYVRGLFHSLAWLLPPSSSLLLSYLELTLREFCLSRSLFYLYFIFEQRNKIIWLYYYFCV